MVDDWEASMPEYQRTAIVLDHFDHAINTVHGGVSDEDGGSSWTISAITPTNPVTGTMHPVRVMLLAGSDLIHTMSEPGVWSAPDVSPFIQASSKS
jgi:nicotinamide mononucleotide adenylyltransferase